MDEDLIHLIKEEERKASDMIEKAEKEAKDIIMEAEEEGRRLYEKRVGEAKLKASRMFNKEVQRARREADRMGKARKEIKVNRRKFEEAVRFVIRAALGE